MNIEVASEENDNIGIVFVLLIDNGFAEIPTIITPVLAVTKDSIDATVVEGGFYTSEQIYQN